MRGVDPARTVASLTELAARVRSTEPRLGAVRLILVDGPAGSGKTTLAAELAAALGRTEVVHLDDLYEGWSALDRLADLQHRLTTQVLDPIADGNPGLFRRYDWHAGEFDGWVSVPRAPTLLVEGVGAAARPVDDRASLRVWVEAPADLRIARGIARDGEGLRAEWLRWAEREAEHFAADATRDRADVYVDGTQPLR